MFGFKQKKKTSADKGLENYIVDNISRTANVEKAIITYILLTSKKNKIKLVRSKDDEIYINFANPALREFLKQWYELLNLHTQNKITARMYEVFVKAQLEETGIVSDDEENGIIEL